MKKSLVQILSFVLFFTMLYMITAQEVLAQNKDSLSAQAAEAVQNTNVLMGEGTTVTTSKEFMDAISGDGGLVIVSGVISLGEDADSSGKMQPVMFPADTTILGTEGSCLIFRCPIQLAGDNVLFQNIELNFNSSTALGSVSHREIFLAGHSLTLDNVSTYLEGAGGSLGSISGSEAELLPTVYAGGFEGKAVGKSASLRIINANDKTVFQGIYMSHTSGEDNKVAYSGNAVLELSPKTAIRDGIYTDMNTAAAVNITESEYVKELKLFGNEQTVLNISKANVQNVTIDNVGSVVLKENAEFALKKGTLKNITLMDNACLDLTAIADSVVAGNFTGGIYDTANDIDTKGILVLNKEGTLTILGNVSGTTQFQTGSRNVPGTLYAGTKYIVAGKTGESDFILAEKYIQNGYKLSYEKDGWIAAANWSGISVGSIGVIAAPLTVDISKIKAKEDGSIPDENIYCELVWKDEEGYPLEKSLIYDYGLYGMDYILGVRTEYLNSADADILASEDWGNAVWLTCTDENTNKYYFEAYDGAKTGSYTFLAFADTVSAVTVADVLELKDTAMAAFEVSFYDSAVSPEPTPKPEPEPEPEPEVHVHNYMVQVTKEATCTQKGVKTYTCQGCKHSYTEDIPLKEHSYAETIKKAGISKNGSITVKCKNCNAVKSTKKIYSPKKVKLSDSSYTYNGKARKPAVTITDTKGNKISSKYYSLSYTDNKKVGIATVKIRFNGRYSGTMEKTFSIIPQKTSISKLTGKAKGFTLKWKKQNTQTSGYQIQYSTSSKFSKKSTETVTIKSNKTTTKTIKKLKAKKKYYVRIRTYKNITLNGKTVKAYSNWSASKHVTTKK